MTPDQHKDAPIEGLESAIKIVPLVPETGAIRLSLRDFAALKEAARRYLAIQEQPAYVAPLVEALVIDRYRLAIRPSIGDVFICDRGEGRWCVENAGFVLNTEGEWEWEPSPSGRTDEFKARTRYASAEEALAEYERATGGK